MDIDIFAWASKFIESHKSFVNNLFWVFVGAILEPSIGKLGGYMASNLKRRRQAARTRKLCKELDDIQNAHQVEILNTDDQPYDPRFMEVSETGQSFYIGFPQDLMDDLKEKYGDSFDRYFEIHADTAFDGVSGFGQMGEEVGIPDLPQLIEEARYEVARSFLDSEKGWHFNAGKYGVWAVDFARKWGGDESRSLQLSLYKTDYFTFNVTQTVYGKLKRDPRYRQIVEDMTTDITPRKLHKYRLFLSAFGVNAMVFLKNRAEGILCVLTERSTLAADTPGTGVYHVTMNEGLTLIDKDSEMDKVRLSTCLRRGLREELGLNDDVTTTRMTAEFHDLFLVKRSYQLGISASVVLDDMDFEELHGYWGRAKDRNLETRRLVAFSFDRKTVEKFFSRHDFIPYSRYIVALICAHKGVTLDQRKMGWEKHSV